VARMKNKFNAIKTTVDGLQFDSRAEARRWQELKLLERAGEIERLERQVPFSLVVEGQKIATYTADFRYWTTKSPKERIVEDVKSPPTAKKRDFILIRKLMRAIHRVDITVVM